MSTETPRLSILIPSIPSRIERFLLPLLKRLETQADGKSVEILTFIDNKKRSVGLKRDSLVQIARGDYLAFVDDDDEVTDDYVASIVEAINTVDGVDVVTFKQWVTINDGNQFTVDFSIQNQNEEAKVIEGVWQDIKRQPFHICVWRSELAKKHRFTDASYGEDWHWAKRVIEDVGSEAKIDKHLHYYRYSDAVTEAALDFAKEENVFTKQ